MRTRVAVCVGLQEQQRWCQDPMDGLMFDEETTPLLTGTLSTRKQCSIDQNKSGSLKDRDNASGVTREESKQNCYDMQGVSQQCIRFAKCRRCNQGVQDSKLF